MLYVNDTCYDERYFEFCFRRFENHEVLGSCEGRRYAVRMPDPALWLALCLYAKDRGASVFPLPADLPDTAAIRRARLGGCHFLLMGNRGESALENVETVHCAEPQSANEPGLVQMSSGTTGDPKCVERSWASVDQEIEAYLEHFEAAEDTRPVIACPVTHSYGLISGALVGLARGAMPVIIDTFNPKYILTRLADTDHSLLYSSPALLGTLARLSGEDGPMDAAITSGTLLHRAAFDLLRGNVRRLHQQYGCSETGCLTIGQDIETAHQLGTPLPHVELTAGAAAAEPEEITAKLPGSPAVRTRDLGYLRGDQVYFVSRMDDLINVSGLNVYPTEVEDVVLEMPGVEEAVVYGRSHPLSGNQVCLDFVASETISEPELRQWCARRLARHQVPMRVRQVPEIHKLPNGKVSRKALSDALN